MSRGYPSPTDYRSALRQPDRHVLDPVLRTGQPRLLLDGGPMVYSGGFASVFVVDAGGSSYALRCWTRDVGDAADHYQAINGYLGQVRLPYFTNFHFLPEGIVINGAKYPTLRMDWLDGEPLREFIGEHFCDAQILDRTAVAFLDMSRELHRHRIAHGDLQSDNLNVRERGDKIELRLLDYDTLYVPTKRATPVSSIGIPAYQHPRRGDSPIATEKDDYYSELVIYLTLLALAEDSGLWRDYHIETRDKELLFAAADLTASHPSALFHRLRKLSPLVSHLTLMLWNFTRHPDILTLPPLEEAIRLAQARIASGNPAMLGGFDLFLAQNVGQPATGGRSASDAWFDEWPAASTPPPRRAASRPAREVVLPTPTPPDLDPADTAFDMFLQKGAPQGSGTAVSSPATAPATSPGSTPAPPSQGTPTTTPSPTSESVRTLLGCLFWAFVIILVVYSCSHHSQ